MHDQCPACYSYDIVGVRRRNIFLWIGLSLAVNAMLMVVVFSGLVENIIPWIIGFILLDSLIMLPLMAALRLRGMTYRCRACGHTWSEMPATEAEESTMAKTGVAGSSSTPSAAGFQMTVQDVFSIKGRGTVVTGVVESGAVMKGATIAIHGQAGVIETVVDAVEIFRKVNDWAGVGDNVGLLLRGVETDDVHPGDVLRGRG